MKAAAHQAALAPFGAGQSAAANAVHPHNGLRELYATDDPVVLPLVTGAGRSGTHSVAKYLNVVGIPAVHTACKSPDVSEPSTRTPTATGARGGAHGARQRRLELCRSCSCASWQLPAGEETRRADSSAGSLVFAGRASCARATLFNPRAGGVPASLHVNWLAVSACALLGCHVCAASRQLATCLAMPRARSLIDCDAAPSSRISRPRSGALAIRLPTTGWRTSTRWAASIVCVMASLADDAAASIPQLHPAPQVSYDYAARCVANNTWLHAILHRPFPPSRLTLATAYWMSWNSLAAKHAQVQTRV